MPAAASQMSFGHLAVVIQSCEPPPSPTFHSCTSPSPHVSLPHVSLAHRLLSSQLFDAIINRGSFPEEEARLLLKQLLSALAYCHALGVVHRDLKPENVLFEEDEATRADGVVGSLKLIDFGYAALHKPGERLRGLSGTPDYVAPEVLSWYEGDDQAGDGGGGGVEYDASCDMWSIGVILFILLCGFPPFYAEAEPELIQKVREGQFEFTSPYWDDISASAKDLISRCLALHPEDRPTPTEALRHPWVGGVAAAAQPAQEQEPIAAPASAPPRGSDAQRAPVPPASLPPAYDEPAPQEDEAEDDDYFDDQSDASPPPREPEPRVEPRKHKQQSPPLRNVPTRGGGGSAAAPAPSAPTMSASSDAAASMKPGELISRIRRMRQSYAPGHPMQARSGADGAPGLQLTMDGSGPPQVQAAPTREALEAQGATFVKVPRSLFQDIYALVEAQRRGELPEAGEHPLSEVLQALSAQVQRGDLGTQLGRDAK